MTPAVPGNGSAACCAGHNLRLILKRLRHSCARFFCRSVFRWVFRWKRVLSGTDYGFGVLNAA